MVYLGLKRMNKKGFPIYVYIVISLISVVSALISSLMFSFVFIYFIGWLIYEKNKKNYLDNINIDISS